MATKSNSTSSSRPMQADTTQPQQQARARDYTPGTNHHIQLRDCTSIEVHTPYDDPIHEWLAAKRQQIEQKVSLLRHRLNAFGPGALYNVESAQRVVRDIESGEGINRKEVWYSVPQTFHDFGRAAIELFQCETDLRRLGVMPERCGITADVWEMFLAEVVEPETDEADEADVEAEGEGGE